MSTWLLPLLRLSRRAVLLSPLVGLAAFGAHAAELLPPGFRPLPLGVHALVGAKVVPKPGEIIENGTILLRDGFIQAVGQDLTPPADARVWDLKGATIYAGFIDPYLVLGATNSPVTTADSEPISSQSFTAAGVKFYGSPGVQVDMGSPGPANAIARLTPEYRAVQDYSPKDKTLAPLREAGFTAGVIVPARGIIRGSSALVGLVEESPNDVVLKADVFQHVVFDTQGGGERAYPSSLMGVIAAVRQAFLDSQHYALARSEYEKEPQGHKRPEFNLASESLPPSRKLRVAFEPGSALMVDRAARIAAEMQVDFCVVSCGQEWRRPELAKAAGTAFIVPLNFPSLPKLPADDDWDQVTLDQLRAWDWAPENPAVLRKQNLEVALTTYGLSDKSKFRQNLRLALDRGLSELDALAALTVVPAKLCGVEKLLGTIEPGKLANLTVVKGDSYFDPEAKVREVWIDGRVYSALPEDAKLAKGETKEPPSPNGETPDKAKEEPEKHSDAPDLTPGTKPAAKAPAAPSPGDDQPGKKKREQARELQKSRVARSPLDGRGPLATPASVLVHNATVWTCGPEGRLEDADVLIVGGKIKAVGKGLRDRSDYPGPPLDIDGHGFHVTPGLIDCHSHTAILGSVNEGTVPSSAMVRIHDVVNSESSTLYEQLAGGVTTVNLLHGSANPIGGQNCVIKLRDGALPEELVFAAAPPGIKFALGENVKQSNASREFATRFPQSRMGVRTFVVNRFTAAQQYLAEWADCRKAVADGKPAASTPRRDLELEAIGEIIEGKRWIHCHSYRQDEILSLLRVMEGFGVKVGTLQHILEGYKVADEIAQHGAGASTFADWWAYKFEVYDAIPYNGSLMRERGVVVSFNSDSSELARRLYLEAAKAVKYGGTSEVEAMKFVTYNPAQQLRVDSFVGSLEPGKDADFAVWSKSPLDSGTVCLQTWIEGKKYFDRSLNAGRAAALAKERSDLLAKAKKIGKISGGGGDGGSKEGAGGDDTAAFFRVSLEHQFDNRERDCLDER